MNNSVPLYHHVKNNRRGGSFLEIIVIIATIGALLRLALPNFYEFQSRAYDAAALKTYNALKEELMILNHSNQPSRQMLFNQLGNGKPLPLFPKVVPSKGVIVHYALFIPSPEDVIPSQERRIALEISHRSGGTIYRYLRVGSEVLEQQIIKAEGAAE